MFNLTNGINRDFTNNSIPKGESIMAYRSDVTYAILFRELSCKRKFVSLYKLHPVFSKALNECHGVDDDELRISAKFDWVHWYETYDDVKCHMQMLESIEADDLDGVSAKFARVGEESDDTDELEWQGYDAPHSSDIEVYVVNHPQVYNRYL